MTEQQSSNGQPKGTPRHALAVEMMAPNEAKNLPCVAGRIPAIDNTVVAVRDLRTDPKIAVQTRKGNGSGLACGFMQATLDLMVLIDLDGSTSHAKIAAYVDAPTRGGLQDEFGRSIVKGARAYRSARRGERSPQPRVGRVRQQTCGVSSFRIGGS